MSRTANNVLLLVIPVIALLFLIQAIPYGKDNTNPPVLNEPAWDSPATRALAKRACFDCHSHETLWPRYSLYAPFSWLVQYDVDKGRQELNFSDWRNGAREAERADKIREEISEGGMPPLPYRLAHPQARLQDAEKQQLIKGLTQSAAPR